MGVLRRIPLLLIAGIALVSCDTEDDKCKGRICTRSAGSEPSSSLDLQVDVDGGWDSVWVEVHSGETVEQSTLHAAWGTRSGNASRTLKVNPGKWSGHAVYIRPGDTLDTYDADETEWNENNDECGCFEDWSPENGKLDLRED